MSGQTPRNMECQDLYLGCQNTIEDNTGLKTTVKKGDDVNYSHTIVAGSVGFVRDDTGASYRIEGGKNTSLNVIEVVAATGVKIKEDGARKEVCGKGGPGTQIASTVVKNASEVSFESKNKEAVIRRKGAEGAILAEKVILDGKVALKEDDSKIIVASGKETADSS